MGAPFILTLLSSDGYQVFAALHREFETLPEAIEGAKDDYLRRYGGNPAFRVYHAAGGGPGTRHTLIEVCFDESKRRSFVALYKVLRESEPAPTRAGSLRPSLANCGRAWRKLVVHLGRLLPRPRASGPVFQYR